MIFFLIIFDLKDDLVELIQFWFRNIKVRIIIHNINTLTSTTSVSLIIQFLFFVLFLISTFKFSFNQD